MTKFFSGCVLHGYLSLRHPHCPFGPRSYFTRSYDRIVLFVCSRMGKTFGCLCVESGRRANVSLVDNRIPICVVNRLWWLLVSFFLLNFLFFRFFSLGVSWGGLMMFGSYNKFNNKINYGTTKKSSANFFLDKRLTPGAGEGVDPAQKLTRPKHTFSGAEWHQKSFWSKWRKRVSDFYLSNFNHFI